MKKLSFLFVFMLVATMSHALVIVIIHRNGQTYVEIREDCPGGWEGVTCIPFFNVAPPSTVGGSAGSAVPIRQGQGDIQAGTGIGDPANATAILCYTKDKTLHFVALSDDSDWGGLLEHFRDKGCTPDGYGIFWMPKMNGNSLMVNGQTLKIDTKQATCPRGDIIINKEPIGIE